MITAKVLEQFTNLTKKSLHQYISDLITERLKSALTKEDEANKEQEKIHAEADKLKEDAGRIVTTEEELEGFMIVKSIVRQKVSVNRITHRDALSYFAILLDDNNRKTICRLYLNGSKKYLATFDENKKEIKNEINTLDDIFFFSDALIQSVINYDKAKEAVA